MGLYSRRKQRKKEKTIRIPQKKQTVNETESKLNQRAERDIRSGERPGNPTRVPPYTPPPILSIFPIHICNRGDISCQ